MQRHGGLEVGLGRVHFDGDAKHLHHFENDVDSRLNCIYNIVREDCLG